MPHNYLAAAIEIAREAGQILREEFARPAQISYKGDVDIRRGIVRLEDVCNRESLLI